MTAPLNKALVLRLGRYLRVLQKLKSLGFIKVFSNNLGDAIGVTPAVVRKDFSQINIAGNKRGGYAIDTLILQITRILGKEDSQDVVLVGCGKIGSALMEYREFRKEGIRIAAAFDSNPEKQDLHGRIPIYEISELSRVVREGEIKVGIIAVPDEAANSVFERLLEAGVQGILNFTSVELKCAGKCDPANCGHPCIIQNVNIGLEIENLFYLVHMQSAEVRGLSVDELKERQTDSEKVE